MKKLNAYFLLLVCSAAIVASAVSVLQGAYFMLAHFAGSAILLAFIFTTGAFKEVKPKWGVTQKILLVFAWIYNVFLVASFAGSIAVTIFFHAWRKLGYVPFVLITIVGLYAFGSIRYCVKAKKRRVTSDK